MAFELHLESHQLSGGLAATALLPRTPVKSAGTSGLLLIPLATMADVAIGITGAATHLAGEVPVCYFDGNVVKAKAGASMGAGVEVTLGSTNGTLWPVTAASTFAASAHIVLGTNLAPAAAGEICSIHVRVRKF